MLLNFHFEILRLKKCHLAFALLLRIVRGLERLVHTREACHGTPNTPRARRWGRGRSTTLSNHPTRISYAFPRSLAPPERPGEPPAKKETLFLPLSQGGYEVSELQNWTHIYNFLTAIAQPFVDRHSLTLRVQNCCQPFRWLCPHRGCSRSGRPRSSRDGLMRYPRF